jgi:hypothetical protein
VILLATVRLIAARRAAPPPPRAVPEVPKILDLSNL